MPRRIIFKNASSGQKGVTIQRYVQDTSLLWERTRLECSFDVEIHTEEVLVLLTALINDNYLDDNKFAGDNERFIMIDYEKDKSKPPSKFEEFKAKNKGIPKSQQYASIRTNITQSAYFDNKNSFRIGNTFKSVCTDGAYIDVTRQYNKFITQTIKNITTLDYLDQINVFFSTGGEGIITFSKLEKWNDLYILEPRSEPYQIQPYFFGDTQDLVSSNKFWILPPQFKKYGITYELYHEGDPPQVISLLSELATYNFTINEGILKIENVDTFCSYKLLFGSTPISGSFSQYTDINATNMIGQNLTWESVITCTRYEPNGATPLHQFSFVNNVAEGLTGYYHQLDETKTTQNNAGFFEEELYKRGENIANILLALQSQRWFSAILVSGTNLPIVFNYRDTRNQLAGGYEEVGFDGLARYAFIDNVDGNGVKSIADAGGITRNFYGYTFNRISFKDTKITNCDFSGSHFEECDFTGSVFEDCTFTNITSDRNIWQDFNDQYILQGTNNLKTGHKMIGGRFVGNDINTSGDAFNVTVLRSYKPRTQDERNILTDLDVSMNFTDSTRIDEVVFRSVLEVDPYVKVEIDLSYVNLDDVSATDVSNLDSPFNIFVKESGDPGYVQLMTLDTRLILTPPPVGHKNMSLYNQVANSISVPEFFYRKYAFYYSEQTPFDHAVENPLFYNYQFQKDLTNPKGLKLFGFNNTNKNDYAHVGSWGIGASPYNTINSDDVLISFDQAKSSTFGYNIVGPLTYYKLDVSYNKYNETGGAPFLHKQQPTNFKLRKGNLNYEYIDTTSQRVANREDKTNNPIRYKAEVITSDPSLNYSNVKDLYNKLDNEYIENRPQIDPDDGLLEYL